MQKKTKVFVAMQYTEIFKMYYDTIYKVAIEQSGCEAIVADESNIGIGNYLLETVLNLIDSSDIVLVEATGANPNVMYEWGYALADNKIVIPICLQSEASKLPTDTKSIIHIQYSVRNPEHAIVQISSAIKAKLDKIDNSEYGSLERKQWNFTSDTKIPLKHIRLLDWDNLPQGFCDKIYERFLEMNAKTRKVYSEPFDCEYQTKLDKNTHINLDPLKQFLSSFKIYDDYIKYIKLPLSPVEYELFHGNKLCRRKTIEMKIIDQLVKNIQALKTSAALTEEQISCSNNLIQYLSCDNEYNNKYNNAQNDKIDFVFVSGCRKRAIMRRMEEVNEIINENANAQLFISGSYEYNNEDGGMPVSESEIMLYCLRRQYRQYTKNIILDNNSRNGMEAILHSINHIKNIYAKKKTSVNVAIVTSPYFMRRLLLQFYHCSQLLADNVINFIPRTAKSDYNKYNWLGLDENGIQDRDGKGIKVYINEYFKLIGGRVIGEF